MHMVAVTVSDSVQCAQYFRQILRQYWQGEAAIINHRHLKMWATNSPSFVEESFTHFCIPTRASDTSPSSCFSRSSSAFSTTPWQLLWSSWMPIIFSLITSLYPRSPNSAPTNCTKFSITALFPWWIACRYASSSFWAFSLRDEAVLVLKWTEHFSDWGS